MKQFVKDTLFKVKSKLISLLPSDERIRKPLRRVDQVVMELIKNSLAGKKGVKTHFNGGYRLIHFPEENFTLKFPRDQCLCEYRSVIKGYYDGLELEEGGTVINLGAYFGLYSFIAAMKGCKVFAVEPDPITYKALVKNIKLNCLEDKVMPVRVALSDHEGQAELYLSDKHCSSFYLEEGVSVTVKVTTLDKLVEKLGIKHVDAILMDVEGAELEIVEGAEKLLTEQVPAPQLRIASYHLRNGVETQYLLEPLLKRMGYGCYTFNPSHVTTRASRTVSYETSSGKPCIQVSP